MEKIVVEYGKAILGDDTVIAPDIAYYCGFGEHGEGLYGYGETPQEAFEAFVEKLNGSNEFTIARR